MKTINSIALLLLLIFLNVSQSLAQGIPLNEKALGRLVEVLSGKKLEDSVQTRGRGDIFAKYVSSVPFVISADGSGSSAVIRTNLPESSTLVVTNNHVVDSPFTDGKGHSFVLLLFYDPVLASEPFERERLRTCMQAQGTSSWCKAFQQSLRPALVIATDPSRDLALLLVKNVPKGVDEIPSGQIEGVKPGDDVFVLGHPFELLWSLTTGIVSAVRQQFPMGTPPRTSKGTVIQTQAPVNPGNSGGPMMTPEGRLVGVVFAQRLSQLVSGAAGPSGTSGDDIRIPAPGINLAIGVNEVQSLVAEFNKKLRK